MPVPVPLFSSAIADVVPEIRVANGEAVAIALRLDLAKGEAITITVAIALAATL